MTKKAAVQRIQDWFPEEAERAFPGFPASPERPIILPELDVLQEQARSLQARAAGMGGGITIPDLLETYQILRLSASNTAVFCGWKDSFGALCGAKMDIQVDAFGAYYQCQTDTKHRTPK